MKTEERVKYYDGFVVEDGQEVTAEAARGLANHAKAFFSAPGQLDRVELYSRGKLSRVDYPGERSDDDVKATHSKMYKGVGFTTRRKLTAVRDLIWEEAHSYSASGGLEGFTLILQGQSGRGLMEVNLDKNKKVLGVTKYYWEDPDDLRYVFEYNQGGRLVSVYDLMYGDQASFEDLKKALPDSHFFESGLNLPREIANTAIPL
ncbi:hypothetical protein JRI60_23825 [Archangium violaceum]|uniref:hypothetical protein n=1 Tax=Archangium violaceum TaxID=83451 RepID=UPI0019523703|nr:hypothetical protein [Archangium violaceum]QRO01829.1 hypothetical protein JRI60_23825 [Archangium violaceum]